MDLDMTNHIHQICFETSSVIKPDLTADKNYEIQILQYKWRVYLRAGFDVSTQIFNILKADSHQMKLFLHEYHFFKVLFYGNPNTYTFGSTDILIDTKR